MNKPKPGISKPLSLPSPRPHSSLSLARAKTPAKKTSPFQASAEGTRCIPSDPSSPPSLLRTPPHLELLSMFPVLATHKMAAEHLPEETAAPPLQRCRPRLRIFPLAQPQSARRAETADSQSVGGAIRRRRAAGDKRAEPLRCGSSRVSNQWAPGQVGGVFGERLLPFRISVRKAWMKEIGRSSFPAWGEAGQLLQRWGLVNGEVLPVLGASGVVGVGGLKSQRNPTRGETQPRQRSGPSAALRSGGRKKQWSRGTALGGPLTAPSARDLGTRRNLRLRGPQPLQPPFFFYPPAVPGFRRDRGHFEFSNPLSVSVSKCTP